MLSSYSWVSHTTSQQWRYQAKNPMLAVSIDLWPCKQHTHIAISIAFSFLSVTSSRSWTIFTKQVNTIGAACCTSKLHKQQQTHKQKNREESMGINLKQYKSRLSNIILDTMIFVFQQNILFNYFKTIFDIRANEIFERSGMATLSWTVSPGPVVHCDACCQCTFPSIAIQHSMCKIYFPSSFHEILLGNERLYDCNHIKPLTLTRF